MSASSIGGDPYQPFSYTDGNNGPVTTTRRAIPQSHSVGHLTNQTVTTLNPLFGPHPELTASSSDSIIGDVKKYNQEFKSHLRGAVNLSKYPVPSVVLLELEVRKFLRNEIEKRNQTGQDLISCNRHLYKKICQETVHHLVISNALIHHTYQRK